MEMLRDELLDGLAAVLEHGAAERFVAGPIIVHDAKHFPDPWSADLVGVHTALRRVLRHAGLGELTVVLEDAREGGGFDRETGVHFVEIVGDRVVFAVTAVPPPKHLVAILCLEVARAWSVYSGLVRGHGGAYRHGVEADPDDPPTLVGEEIASMVMFALGFGVIAVNGSADLVKSEDIHGAFVVGRWQQVEIGGLPAPACAFLLAAQLAVRGIEGAELSAIESAVLADHRAAVTRELRDHRGDVQRLVDKLGLPPREDWPEPWDADVEPLAEDDEAEAELRERDAAFREEVAQPNRGDVVFRVVGRRTLPGAVLGGIAAGAATLAVSLSGGLATAVILGGLASGAAVGRRVRTGQCSDRDCEHRLGADERVCPGCGGAIVGDIASASQRLEALEAYERRIGSPDPTGGA